MTFLRLAHISDPHFGSIVLHPNQFLSKRWIGNFNLLLLRSKFYHITPLFHLPEVVSHLKADTICFTGDFSSTATTKEFSDSSAFIKQFKQKTFCLPGNHDCYTKEVESKQLYYDYFPEEHLKKKRVTSSLIKEKWWWVGLDCTVATPPFNAYGIFSNEMAAELEKTLSEIPKDHFIIVGNHYPLFPSGSKKHDLKGTHLLQKILEQFPNIRLYLHGHDHLAYFIDARKQGLPLVNNAGSCARKRDGGFSLFELDESKTRHQRFRLSKGKEVRWELSEDTTLINI